MQGLQIALEKRAKELDGYKLLHAKLKCCKEEQKAATRDAVRFGYLEEAEKDIERQINEKRDLIIKSNE